MNDKQIYQKIVTGEFYWKGNLEKLIQHTEIKVMPPAVDVRGKKLPAKIIIESWLEDREDKTQRDHFSIRISSIAEFFSLLCALILAFKEYLRYMPANKIWAYNKIIEKIKQVWRGEYDNMIRR